MMRGLRAAADLLLPRVCVVCGRKLHLDEEHLCLMCWAELPLTHFWERSHNPMADKFNGLIETALDGRERYVYAAALFFYDGAGTFRRIPHQLKYHADLRLGRRFGRILGQKLRLAGHLCDVDLVIPVPLHWTRRWKRGYNQAEVIAAEVARVLGIEMRTDILKRSRRTRTQTKVAPRDKSANVTGAFIARITQLNSPETHTSPEAPRKLEVQTSSGDRGNLKGQSTPEGPTGSDSKTCPDGKTDRDCQDIRDNQNRQDSRDSQAEGNAGYRHILLIDDVFTSGSTLMACFRALRAVFPPSVRISVATLAFVGGA